MLRRHLLVAAIPLLLLLPGVAAGRSWKGISPGQSTRADVVARFGEPSTRGLHEGRSALVYLGDQAIAGTRQAQFFLANDGRVAEIIVFPSSVLEREAVLGTYGKDPQKTFTEDFRNVWRYPSIGVVVFFGKDGTVEAIQFLAPEKPAPPAPAEPAVPTPPPAGGK